MQRGVKKIIHTPSQTVLEGNGAVFETFTINNLQLLVFTFSL